jgi:hypothetical protein
VRSIPPESNPIQLMGGSIKAGTQDEDTPCRKEP